MGSIFAIPAVLFLFIRPDVGAWRHGLEIAACIFIFSLGGFGSLLAILTRAGIVEFTYADTDKQGLEYKLSKLVAERERYTRFGATFSKRYFMGTSKNQRRGWSASGVRP